MKSKVKSKLFSLAVGFVLSSSELAAHADPVVNGANESGLIDILPFPNPVYKPIYGCFVLEQGGEMTAACGESYPIQCYASVAFSEAGDTRAGAGAGAGAGAEGGTVVVLQSQQQIWGACVADTAQCLPGGSAKVEPCYSVIK